MPVMQGHYHQYHCHAHVHPNRGSHLARACYQRLGNWDVKTPGQPRLSFLYYKGYASNLHKALVSQPNEYAYLAIYHLIA